METLFNTFSENAVLLQRIFYIYQEGGRQRGGGPWLIDFYTFTYVMDIFTYLMRCQ